MSDISTEWKELRSKLGDLICHIDGMNESIESKMKKLQEKEEEQADLQALIDKAYNMGIQNLYDAICCLFACYGRIPPMPDPEMCELFGTVQFDKMVVNNTPEEIIDKVNQWKAEKDKEEQKLHVGDEILVINSDDKLNNRTFIIYEIDDRCYYVIEPITLYKDGFFKNAYIKNQIKKTGKHYDSIPLSKEENK